MCIKMWPTCMKVLGVLGCMLHCKTLSMAASSFQTKASSPLEPESSISPTSETGRMHNLAVEDSDWLLG